MSGKGRKRSGENAKKPDRNSEIVMSYDKAVKTQDLDTSGVEDYGSFADRLQNPVNDEPDKKESTTNSSRADTSELGNRGPYFSRTLLLLTVIMPFVAGLIFAGYQTYQKEIHAFVFPDSSPVVRTMPKKSARVPQSSPKPPSNWREEVENGHNYRLLTEDEIKYTEGGRMYLVVVGHVFDVTAGAKMYAEGSDYHAFIGRDATRAFVSGKFDDEGLVSDLDGLSLDDLKGISGWADFYMKHEKYKFIGILKGWFFDVNGYPTEKLLSLLEKLEEADRIREVQAKVEEQFPSCNVEWTAETGSRVWCSAGSGGIQRDWVGLPRLFHEGEGKTPRCACVHPKDLQDVRVKLYDECPKTAVDCKIK